MIIGHERQVKFFEKLTEENNLSGSYIFFGEPQIGKFSFAESIAKKLEPNSRILTELLVIKPDDNGSIGIDEIRTIKRFLSKKPVNAPRRSIIIDNAESLTPQAENSLLKITEEPPENSLIIMIVANPDVLLSTLASRFRKIYFSRVKTAEIQSWLQKEHGFDEKTALSAAAACFGRPGLAFEMKDEEPIKNNELETLGDYRIFIKNKIIDLYKDKIKNFEEIKALIRCLYFIEQFNTNKKLQLQAALWTR